MVFLLSIPLLNAQRVVKKSLLKPNTSFIQIDATNCYEMVMETSESSEIMIEARINGEYKKDLLLNIREEGTSVTVSVGFHPNFVNPNDKLGAHKVISISLRVKIPSQQNVRVYGTACDVLATGAYKYLKVTLADGRCSLDQVSEAVEVTTQGGDIFLKSTGAEIVAVSKYGTIKRDSIPIGDNRFALTTVTGNIHLRKTE